MRTGGRVYLDVRVMGKTSGDEKTLNLSFLELRFHVVIMDHQVLVRIVQVMDIFQSLLQYFSEK